MKPIHYVKKYKLNQTSHFNHNDFISDFTLDFMTLLEFQQRSGVWNYPKFKNCIKDVRQKWDSISNKTLGTGLPDKLWNYFFASVVVPVREEMFGDYLKAKKDQYEERKAEQTRRREEWQRWRDPWGDPFAHFFGGEGKAGFWERMLRNMKLNTIPTESFQALGLVETANINDVKDAYRNLVKVHHPDKGGSKEKFCEATDAKNRCLAYLT